MRIIVDHMRTRRTIDGTFNFIGYADDLRDMAEQILQQVGDDDTGKNSYCTVYITEKHHGVANIAPKGWEE